jgi:hypothetical protein
MASTKSQNERCEVTMIYCYTICDRCNKKFESKDIPTSHWMLYKPNGAFSDLCADCLDKLVAWYDALRQIAVKTDSLWKVLLPDGAEKIKCNHCNTKLALCQYIDSKETFWACVNTACSQFGLERDLF